MIVIINSGYGNFKSVQNMISKIGFKAKLTNNYDEVLDCGITKGHTNWQLYGSQKPGYEKYKLTRYILCEWDEGENSWDWSEQNLVDITSLELLKLMSAQNKQFISDLVPRHPIYIDLLPDVVQEVIGKPNEHTIPALKLLESEGFSFVNSIY